MSLAFALALVIAVQAAPVPSSSPRAGAPADGLQIFRRHCGVCHGVNGQGYRGPDLTTGGWSAARNDAALAQLIRVGIPSSGMPGTTLPEPESTALIVYLRTLSGPARVTTGNAVSGQRLFSGKGGCVRCHMVAGSGGRLGPDLTFTGGARSAAFLRRELTDPSDYIRRGYDPVTVVLPDGQRVRGALKNEDLFSVQMMTAAGELRSYLKSEVREVLRETESLMPAFGSTLTAAELDDVLRFLSSLGAPSGAK